MNAGRSDCPVLAGCRDNCAGGVVDKSGRGQAKDCVVAGESEEVEAANTSTKGLALFFGDYPGVMEGRVRVQQAICASSRCRSCPVAVR